MNKPTIAVSCPIDTYSGYGARARDLVKAIIQTNKYNVQIVSQRWGNTRFGYLLDHNEDELWSLIVPKLTNQPDIWVQITVPNEFNKVGKYNIGVTAGMETTLVDPSWIQGVNRMDLVLTSSNHSKTVFEKTSYDVEDKNTKQKSKLTLTTPVEVLLEGVLLDKYFPTNSKLDLSSIKESFCFLNVGHWMQGQLGHDRKNIGYLIKSFYETFKNKTNPPALILKTMKVGTSILDREMILDQIDQIKKTCKGKLPNIYLFHGEVSDSQMNDLYNHPKVKAMVSFTKGEGFGRPLAEFALTKKPIICSGWSGQTDFLKPDMSLLIGGSLEKVDRSAVVKNMILPEAQWFKPDDSQVGKAYKEIFKHYKKYIVPAKRQAAFIKKEFSFERMKDKLEELFDKYIPQMAVQVPLNMPELNLPKLEVKEDKPEFKLPKLKLDESR